MFASRLHRILRFSNLAQSLQLERCHQIVAKHPSYVLYPRNQTSHYPPKQFLSISSIRFSESWITPETRPEYALTFDQFKKAIENDEVYVIDVREPFEVAEGRVPSKRFVNVPVGIISKSMNLPEEDFEAKFGSPKPASDDPIVFMCLGGVRSTFALQNAQASGFKNSRHYLGGWSEWSKYNGET